MEVTEDDLVIMEGILKRCPVVLPLFEKGRADAGELGTMGLIILMQANAYLQERFGMAPLFILNDDKTVEMARHKKIEKLSNTA